MASGLMDKRGGRVTLQIWIDESQEPRLMDERCCPDDTMYDCTTVHSTAFPWGHGEASAMGSKLGPVSLLDALITTVIHTAEFKYSNKPEM
jgi:hypothetical protein